MADKESGLWGMRYSRREQAAPTRPQTAAEEVTVRRAGARLAEARPPAMPLVMKTAGTASSGSSSTRSRYRPKVHRHVLKQNSWIRPAQQDWLQERGIGHVPGVVSGWLAALL